MTITVAMDDQGSAHVFFSPSEGSIIRIEPISLFVFPSHLGSPYGGELIECVLPCELEESFVVSCLGSSRLGSEYHMAIEGGMTWIRRQPKVGKKINDFAYLIGPERDFGFAVSRAAQLARTRIYEHMIPWKFEGVNFDRMKLASLSGDLPLVVPVFDVCGVFEPLWIVDMAKMRRLVGNSTTPRIETINRSLKLEAERSPVGKPMSTPPDDPDAKAEFFGVRQRISFSSSVTAGNEWPFGIAPPDDPAVAVKKGFEFQGESWSIFNFLTPRSPYEGWLFLARSERGVLTALDSLAYESLVTNGQLDRSNQPDFSRRALKYWVATMKEEYGPGDSQVVRTWVSGREMITRYNFVERGGKIRVEVARQMTAEQWDVARKLARMKKLRKRQRATATSKLSMALSAMRKASGRSKKRPPVEEVVVEPEVVREEAPEADPPRTQIPANVRRSLAAFARKRRGRG